jgi:hypothetical protein
MKTKTIIGIALIIVALLFGFFTRIISVFQYITFDIGPDPDQIRDAFVVMKMWQGEFPLLGPRAYGLGLGGHHILPLYYYIFFPFTILGANPVFQVLPNGLFSFLSIPLLIFLVYQILDNISFSQRILLSGLAGFWDSVLFGDIFISNFQWNPSSIPFFFLCFVILYDFQLKNRFSFAIQSCFWAINGVILAILLSLHTSTLFVMPIVFTIGIFLYLFKTVKEKKHWKFLTLPIVSFLSASLALTPYWIGEFTSRFSNTKAILKTLRAGSNSSDSSFPVYIWVKVSNLFLNYLNLVRQAYFWDSSLFYLVVSVIFLAIVTFYGISKFQGNKYIGYILISSLGVFLLAVANIEPNRCFFPYKILILPLPIILTMLTLAYSIFSLKIKYFLCSFIAFVIALSLIGNLFYNWNFIIAKYGKYRLINTQDVTEIIKKIPAKSTICDPKIKRKRLFINQYNYINTYIVKKDIEIVDVCQKGYYVIHPKRFLQIENNFLNQNDYKSTYLLRSPDIGKELTLWPILKVSENQKIARPSKLFLEIETAYVYIIE